MKKLALILCSLVIGLTSTAQSSDTCCQKKRSPITSGRTPYVYIGVGTGLPVFNKANLQTGSYGYSAEMGLWGTEKSTTFGLVGDFMRQDYIKHDTVTTSKSMWLGVKGYLTVLQNSNSVYMIYGSPKMLATKWSGGPNLLMELGINPCYSVNKHILLSVSLCTQIMDMNNNFRKSIWNPGGSIGLVIFK